MDQPRRNIRLAAGLCLALATLTHAAFGHGGRSGGPPSGFPGYGGGDGDDDGDDGDGDASTFFGGGRNGGSGNNPFGEGNGGPGGAGFVGFDISAAMNYRYIHGILCSLAMVLLFPIGSILMRVIPGRFAIWIHAAFQVLAMLVHVAGVGLGIYLVTIVQLPFSGSGASLLTNETTNYHPIIGIVTLVMLLPQPVVGWLHHRKFVRVRRRQVWSYVHLFNGRVGITMGIVNGGLGLNLAAAAASRKRTYIIVAAVMWTLWMLVALWAEVRKARASRKIKDGVVAPPVVDGGKPVVMAGARDVPPVVAGKRRSDSRSGRASRSRSRSLVSRDSRDAAARV